MKELCVQYGECGTWQPLTEEGKPVFQIDYQDGALGVAAREVDSDSICGNSDVKGFETVLKDMDLDDWVQACPYG